ncbi:hypothetical protein DFJ73DRAFT_654380 [Zopfochytrium polystomum]|nr:hypothetical protein DFJ73DRAFT_654380 [Zopfochytrium polystomum]
MAETSSVATAAATIAFFGATGGCTAATLAAALRAGHRVSALARTPSKLADLLVKDHAVPLATVQANLTIVAGDVRDAQAVKKTLTAPTADPAASVPADIIMSGVGSTGTLRANLVHPVALKDPTLCADTAATILAALADFASAAQPTTPTTTTTTNTKKPLFIVISSTGTTHTARDVPAPLIPLYRWILANPHVDKRRMEDAVVAAFASSSSSPSSSLIDSFSVVQPTLLSNDKKGAAKVRAGWLPAAGAPHVQPHSAQRVGPAVGYSVGRADVGEWVFENIVRGDGRWLNGCVSLTY